MSEKYVITKQQQYCVCKRKKNNNGKICLLINKIYMQKYNIEPQINNNVFGIADFPVFV